MPANRPLRVLVVDDDAELTFFLSEALQSIGCTVNVATDGRQALDRFDLGRPDVVLADVHIPSINGIQLLLELRAREVPVPLVFMSAGTTARSAARAYHADAYLAKPFALDDLVATVTSVAAPGRSPAPPEAAGPPVRVLALNGNPDLLRMLGGAVEAAGFEAVAVQPKAAGRTVEAIRHFLEQQAPACVLYDVPPPYRPNWALFRGVRYVERLSGRQCVFVPTTPNKQALERHIGPTGAVELVGDQADQTKIQHALLHALSE